MATKAAKPSDVVARGADVPLALAASGPRDALVDPRDGDIIPDVKDKGLHVGEVRQPAEPVLHAGGNVDFETKTNMPSRFAPTTYAEQVKANSAWEAEQGDLYAGREAVAISVDDKDVAERKAALTKAQAAEAKSAPKADVESDSSAGSIVEDLELDANAVADDQAAEDSADK